MSVNTIVVINACQYCKQNCNDKCMLYCSGDFEANRSKEEDLTNCDKM